MCEATVDPGTCYVAVDTFEGARRAGPYRLRLDLQPEDGWYERPVARGVVLKTKPYGDLFSRRQFGSDLEQPAAHGAPSCASAQVPAGSTERLSVSSLLARVFGQRLHALGQ